MHLVLPFADGNSGRAKNRAPTRGFSCGLGFSQHCCRFAQGRKQKLPGQLRAICKNTTTPCPPYFIGQNTQILRREMINFTSHWRESCKITLQKGNGKGKFFLTMLRKYNIPQCNYVTDIRTFNARTLKTSAPKTQVSYGSSWGLQLIIDCFWFMATVATWAGRPHLSGCKFSSEKRSTRLG